MSNAVEMVGAYAFCGLCAGIAGLLISSNVKSADGNNAGQLLELDAILAVIGYVSGAFDGAMEAAMDKVAEFFAPVPEDAPAFMKYGEADDY